MDYTKIISTIKPSIALVIALDLNKQVLGTGSGFIFKKNGMLVTCNHVIKGAASLLLQFPDSQGYVDCRVVLRDEEHDLALLKFEDDSRQPLDLGKPDEVIEGTQVIFSGYPLSSSDLTTHQGMISAIIRDATGITTYVIDGTVNSGNSGCPLLDGEGKVIGIVNAKRRVRNDLLEKVERMNMGAVSLQGVDLVEIYQALINNVQLGVGYAVPASYIPEHKEMTVKELKTNKKNGK